MPEADPDVALLIAAAQEAGRIAIGMSGPTLRRWDKPGGAGPVTEADLAVNDMLESRLRVARPEYGWLSEETPDTAARLDSDTVFIIDPIDGTRSFADGLDSWSHALAVARHGVVRAAVIYVPRHGLLYHASAGQGAFLNGEPIMPTALDRLDQAEVLATRPNMDSVHWHQGAVPQFSRAHRPSLAWRMALVAQGRFDAMLTLRPAWEWDIAAGDLILREAGAICTDPRGKTLRFNNPHPQSAGVLAGNAMLHDQIRTALRRD